MTTTQDEKGPGRDPRAKDDDNSEGRHNTATGQAHQSPTARRLRLLDAGYAPVPVRGKHPPVDEWQKKTDITIAEVESWATVYPNAHSDGSLTQRMPTFDIDVLNEQAAERVEQLIRQRFAGRGTVLVRIGRAPKRAIPFRTDTPFKKITQNFLAPDGSTNQKFEFLCNGQQVVMFGIHPDTGKPYQWFGGEPGEIRLAELPTISESEATALFTDAINIVAQFGYQPTRARPPTGAAAGSEDWNYLLENIHAGHELHDSTRDLAAKLIVAGTNPAACVNLIRAALNQSEAPRDNRFRQRLNDIPNLVSSAEQKFGRPVRDDDPVDLWGFFEPPSLPTGLLPPVIEEYAAAQSSVMGCDAGGIAMSALTVCSAAISQSIELQMKRHDRYWLEHAHIWTAVVGLPSVQKSPMMKAAAKRLTELDGQMYQQWREEMEHYKTLSAEEKKPRPQPVRKQLRLQDTTIESAQDVLAANPNGMLCIQDELSGWFGAMDKYNGGRGALANRGFWLQAFNGGSYAVNRVGRGSYVIKNTALSMLGGIQPEVMRKLAGDAYDDGLIQRLLTIVCKPAVMGDDQPQSHIVDAYDDLIESLYELQPPTNFGGVGNLTGRLTLVLRFDDDAQKLREQLEQRHIDLLAWEAINKKLASHIGKYNGLFGRLCVIWHCIENADQPHLPAVITFDTANRVAKFLHDYLLPHAVAFYTQVLGLSDQHDRLAAVAGYILAHKLDRVTNRDVQHGDRTMRGLEGRDIQNLFEQLEALAWVDRTPAPRRGDPPHWVVNPKVHIKFKDRGDFERKRRAELRDTILASVKARKGK